MSDRIDPRWPKVLSLTVHEFRTPMTVVAGYIRMLLKERAGAVTDQQRRLLEEAEKSCARLSALVSEVSELSNLEAGTLTFNRQQTDVRAAVRKAADDLPPLPDRELPVELELREGPLMLNGDPVRLAQAFSAFFIALRREIISADHLTVRESSGSGGSAEWLIGDPESIDAMEQQKSDWPVFDEWRGGVGLSLVVARRLIEAHGGQVSGAPDGRKSGVRVRLPLP